MKDLTHFVRQSSTPKPFLLTRLFSNTLPKSVYHPKITKRIWLAALSSKKSSKWTRNLIDLKNLMVIFFSSRQRFLLSKFKNKNSIFIKHRSRSLKRKQVTIGVSKGSSYRIKISYTAKNKSKHSLAIRISLTVQELTRNWLINMKSLWRSLSSLKELTRIKWIIILLYWQRLILNNLLISLMPRLSLETLLPLIIWNLLNLTWKEVSQRKYNKSLVAKKEIRCVSGILMVK